MSPLQSSPATYRANMTQFRARILSNRIEEIVHESFQGALGKSVGASELASWENSLRQMDTVFEDAAHVAKQS